MAIPLSRYPSTAEVKYEYLENVNAAIVTAIKDTAVPGVEELITFRRRRRGINAKIVIAKVRCRLRNMTLEEEMNDILSIPDESTPTCRQKHCTKLGVVWVGIYVERLRELMKFGDTYFSRDDRYSIGIESTSGRYYASIPVSNGIVDYEEYYELTEEQYQHFLR